MKPNTEGTGAGKPARAAGSTIAYRDVLRALPRDETRQRALEAYRATGHTADDFGHVRAARAAMVEALVGTEDAVEAEHPGWRADRARHGAGGVRGAHARDARAEQLRTLLRRGMTDRTELLTAVDELAGRVRVALEAVARRRHLAISLASAFARSRSRRSRC